MSAPPTSVTGAQAPNVPQVPLVSVADGALDDAARRVDAGAGVGAVVERERDGGGRVPRAAARATDWPVGAVESAVTVNVSVAVTPAPFVAVTVCRAGRGRAGVQV